MVGSSSRLIAASYALHRLPTPRHSPCALSNLTTLILVFRGSPDLPAVRLVQQEPSLLRQGFRLRPLGYGGHDGRQASLASLRTDHGHASYASRVVFAVADTTTHFAAIHFSKTRHSCQSQAVNLFGPRDQQRAVGNTGLPGRSSPTFIRSYPPGFVPTSRDFAAAGFLRLERRTKLGGADGVRTHDLLVANQALSQLSYGPRVNAECRRQISLILACPGVVRRIGRGPPGFTAEAASPGQSSSAANAANEAWWAQVDSNHRPRPYQGRALAN